MSEWKAYRDSMLFHAGQIQGHLDLMRSLPSWRGLGDLLNYNKFPDKELEQIRASLARLVSDVDATIEAVAKHRKMHAEAEGRVDALVRSVHETDKELDRIGRNI